MKITKSRLAELVREVVQEEKAEYEQFFRAMLKKYGVSSPAELSDEEKKEFFNQVDAQYKAKNEALKGDQHKLDVDGDGDIEADDLADLRAGKKAEDEIDEKKNPGLWANIRAKRARGEKPAHGNSQAHKDAVKAAKKINKESVVNEETINEIGVLGVASGVALGLVGVIALSKGVGFAKRQFGNAMSVVADKMEKKVKKIESDNAKKAIMDIAKKFENDKKLQGMYQSLPAYKDGGKNSERKKGMAEIAKYVKSKLSSDEMQYFYDLNTYLRTNKIKGTLVAPEKKSAFQKRLDKLGADNAHLSNE